MTQGMRLEATVDTAHVMSKPALVTSGLKRDTRLFCLNSHQV